MLDASSDVHVRLPRRLYESINSLVVKKGYYRSAPEFVLECIREKIDEIKKNRIDQQKINIYYQKLKQEQENQKRDDSHEE
jgi:Arc/MetJ-type ribon-helix-helix transcriptional regulator